MAETLESAMGRLQAALGRLERVVARRLDAELSRGDLETELQLMQDDRARLAVELESSASRLERIEGARGHVERRVEAAIGAIQGVLASAAPRAPDEARADIRAD